MQTDLQQAIALLRNSEYTCVVCKDNRGYHTSERGIGPLLHWLDTGADMMGYSAADKVVGRGAAFLYCLLGVRRVYGQVMSLGAMKVLRSAGIETSWETLTEAIRNRRGDGICPMEAATLGIQEPEEALEVIRKTLKSLTK